jgi:hypothetical protein
LGAKVNFCLVVGVKFLYIGGENEFSLKSLFLVELSCRHEKAGIEDRRYHGRGARSCFITLLINVLKLKQSKAA